jgi:hypothetical protein
LFSLGDLPGSDCDFLSIFISQYFIRGNSTFFALHTAMTKGYERAAMMRTTRVDWMLPRPASPNRARIVFDCRMTNDPASMSSTIPA